MLGLVHMYHTIYESPAKDVGEELSEEPVCKQNLARHKILLPLRPGLEQQHDPQASHSKHVKRRPVQRRQPQNSCKNNK